MAEAERRSSRWTDFCARPGLEPQKWLNLTADIWNGSPSNCPAGYWEGLAAEAPQELASRQEEAQSVLSKHQEMVFGPVLSLAMAGLGEEAVAGRLERMVEAGMLEPEAAVQIAEMVPKG